MMMRDNPYFDPSSVDESRDYYNVPSFNSIEENDEEVIDEEVFEQIFGEKKPENLDGIANGSCEKDDDQDEKDSEPEKHAHEQKEKDKELGIDDIEALLARRQFHTSSLS